MRLFNDIIHKDSFVNRILETVFSIEKKLLHQNIKIPFKPYYFFKFPIKK
jgi:hypothetical protein